MVLSAYRVMWLYVMFDLPTNTAEERDQARKFRENLVNQSFSMIQFSVYARHCLGKEKVSTMINQIKIFIPRGGRVDMLTITDKQFENIVIVENNCEKKNHGKDQIVFF